MAKKKTSKDTETKTFQYSVELTGLILILIGLLGYGFGLVGGIIKKFAMFLAGEWWWIILILILILGIYMIVKRKLPKFFSSRLIGFYVLFIVVVVLSHLTFVRESNSFQDIFQNTFNNYMDRISAMESGAIVSAGPSSISIGGGVFGCIFAALFYLLFRETGTIIVISILAVFGIIMLFDITLADIFEKIKGFRERFKKEKPETDDEEDEEEKIDTEERPVEQIPVDNLEGALEDGVEPTHSYVLPSINLLDEPKKVKSNTTEHIKNTKIILERVLKDFGIEGRVVEIHVGPTVTQYEISIPAGTKVNRITNINKEIALALSAKDVRIQAPIPGKNTIGIEVPNINVSEVRLKEIIGNIPKEQKNYKLLIALGKDIVNRPIRADLTEMPHLLVAGATGSGKSVCINDFIISLLMNYTPDEVKMVLIDPKKVELSNYNGIPHLLAPVVTDPKKASIALQKIVVEMERRYELFSEEKVKNIISYNERVAKQQSKGNNELKRLPYIVVIIDELADLMLIAAKEVEESILRITQLARAAGIHLIVATQRPSTDIITGIIKANIPSRIAFAVSSNVDSRTILDMPGAEKLLGKGDMLYLPMGKNVPIRIQDAFVSEDEIRRVIDHVTKQKDPEYDNNLTTISADDNLAGSRLEKEEYDDPLYNEIVDFAVQNTKISASLIQRRFRLGYNRAARIIDLLEERGIIGPQNGSKPREVLIKSDKKENEEYGD